MLKKTPYSASILRALENTAGVTLRTPIKRLTWLEQIVGVPVYAKLEFQQHTGSFKFRGAINALKNTPKGQIVIAASAGNHALAVAQAAQQLGVQFRICLPVNASRIKREKLIHLGAPIVEEGISLAEATLYAKKLAIKNGWKFLSPFDDSDVIAGCSTLFVEAIEQIPDIKTIFVPVGGGGLISGSLWVNEDCNQRFEIVGVEPKNYASIATSLKAGMPTDVLHRPTLADGLAVQLDSGASTFEIIKRSGIDIVEANEEQIAAGTLMLLQKESWLVEPSGALAISALLNYAENGRNGRLTGPVLLPLTGGNIQKSVLSNILLYPFTDDRLIKFLGLKGDALNDVAPVTNIGLNQTSAERFSAGNNNEVELQITLTKERLKVIEDDLENYTLYCAEADLTAPGELIHFSHQIIKEIQVVLLKLSSAALTKFETKSTLRGLNIATSMVGQWMEWRSPTYSQSVAPQFFQLGSQDSPGVNYDRYGNPYATRVENQLREVLGIVDPDVGCTVVSSGMAAYTIIEAFLLRFRLIPTSKIAVAPYIYFEAAEQLEKLPNLDITRLVSYSAEDMASEICKGDYSVLFVDPMANIAELRICNIVKLLRLLKNKLKKPLTIVIDGTMISAELSAKIFTSEFSDTGVFEIIYYESCSKYLQLGYEYALAGIVVHRNNIRPQLERMRRNTGAILYSFEASLFPSYDRRYYLNHLRKISSSAVVVASSLAENSIVNTVMKVYHPQLDTHPDALHSQSYDYYGGCICFKFIDDGLNNVDNLNSFIHNLLHNAKRQKIAITKGVSFGFVTSRISAASAIAESERAFLRLYVGILNQEEALRLSNLFTFSLASSIPRFETC